MIYWQVRPDPVLHVIVEKALEDSLEFADDFKRHPEEWRDLYPKAARYFTVVTWRRELERLYSAHLAEEVYRPAGPHWVLLAEVLDGFVSCYNDELAEPIVHEGTTIDEIDLEGLVDTFFWKVDPSGAPPARVEGELPLEEVAPGAWQPGDAATGPFVPGCGRYPSA